MAAEKNSREAAWKKLGALEEQTKNITKGNRLFGKDVHGVSEIAKIKKEVLGDVSRRKVLRDLEAEGVVPPSQNIPKR